MEGLTEQMAGSSAGGLHEGWRALLAARPPHESHLRALLQATARLADESARLLESSTRLLETSARLLARTEHLGTDVARFGAEVEALGGAIALAASPRHPPGTDQRPPPHPRA